MKKALLIITYVILIGIACISGFIFYALVVELNYISKNMVETALINLSDNYDEDFQNIRNRSTIVADLIQINDSFHASENFDYFEFNTKGVNIEQDVFKGNEHFAPHNGSYLYNDTLYQLGSISVGESADKYFNFQMESGEYFTSEDYFSKNSNEINIILGYDYMEIYKMGDILSLTYNLNNYQCTVKGFLKQGSEVIKYNIPIDIDNYIVLPIEKFAVPSEKYDEYEHQFRMLLDYNNGTMMTNDVDKAKAEIQEICSSFNLPNYGFSAPLSAFKKTVYAEMTASALLCILSIAGIICVIVISKKRKNSSGKKK